jgi:hypothetical protein
MTLFSRLAKPMERLSKVLHTFVHAIDRAQRSLSIGIALICSLTKPLDGLRTVLQDTLTVRIY